MDIFDFSDTFVPVSYVIDPTMRLAVDLILSSLVLDLDSSDLTNIIVLNAPL